MTPSEDEEGWRPSQLQGEKSGSFQAAVVSFVTAATGNEHSWTLRDLRIIF